MEPGPADNISVVAGAEAPVCEAAAVYRPDTPHAVVAAAQRRDAAEEEEGAAPLERAAEAVLPEAGAGQRPHP